MPSVKFNCPYCNQTSPPTEVVSNLWSYSTILGWEDPETPIYGETDIETDTISLTHFECEKCCRTLKDTSGKIIDNYSGLRVFMAQNPPIAGPQSPKETSNA